MEAHSVTALPYCHVLPLSLYGLVGQGIRVARDPTVDRFSLSPLPSFFLLTFLSRLEVLVDGYNSLDRNFDSSLSTIPSP